ncbi:MAG TPA: WhiB family transcriptional regulator [Candidatus Limnocylindria bacterium]|nr:WhiB family transcriptional regulator [Candidatus Limnocylindria bacterium]
MPEYTEEYNGLLPENRPQPLSLGDQTTEGALLPAALAGDSASVENRAAWQRLIPEPSSPYPEPKPENPATVPAAPDLNKLLRKNLKDAEAVRTLLDYVPLQDASRTPDTTLPEALTVRTVRNQHGIPYWLGEPETPPETPPPPWVKTILGDTEHTLEALSHLTLMDGKAARRLMGVNAPKTVDRLIQEGILDQPVASLPFKLGKMLVWDACQIHKQKVISEDPDDTWRERAACRGNSAVFFPPMETTSTFEKRAAQARAKEICETECPVEQACAAHAHNRKETYGTWGGQILNYLDFSEEELQNLDEGLRIIQERKAIAKSQGLKQVDLLRPIGPDDPGKSGKGIRSLKKEGELYIAPRPIEKRPILLTPPPPHIPAIESISEAIPRLVSEAADTLPAESPIEVHAPQETALVPAVDAIETTTPHEEGVTYEEMLANLEGTGLSPRFFEIFGAVGSHEAKGLLLQQVIKEGGRVTPPRLKRILPELCEVAEADWKPAEKVGFTYYKGSFEPTGLAKGIQGEKWLESYELTPDDLLLVIALTGLLGALSLRHPDFSLQVVPGTGQLQAILPMSQAKVEIVYDLLTHPKQSKGVGISEIQGFSDKFMDQKYIRRMSQTRAALLALESSGLVRVEHAEEENDRQYTVTDPVKATKLKPRTKLKQAMTEFIQTQLDQGTEEFTFSACYQSVLSWLAEEKIEVQPSDVLKSVRNALGKMTTVESKGSYNPGSQSRTRVTIEPPHVPALTELIAVIDAVANGDQEAIRLGHQLARQILTDNESVRTLLNKAYSFSQGSSQPLRQTGQELYDILQNRGLPTDSKTLAEVYTKTYKRPINPPHVQDALASQIEQGALKRTEGTGETSKRKRYLYSIPETQQVQEAISE